MQRGALSVLVRAVGVNLLIYKIFMHFTRYILAFIITGAIFATSFYLATYLNSRRVADIKTTADNLSVDLLSSQTQFELLGSLDCSALGERPVLSEELNSLAERLSVAENNLGTNNEQVTRLKKQYSLLEIRDYILLQHISQKCSDIKPISILYFYSNEGDCEDCARAGEVLTYLRTTYPTLRVYAFDYHLDLSALQTLIHLKHIEGDLPAFIVNNGQPIHGLKTVSEMEALIPNLKSLNASNTPTTTNKKKH